MSQPVTADLLLPFRPAGAPRTRPRVYCFPHAGGEPSAYRDFARALAPEFDAQPVRLPRTGRLPGGGRTDDARALVEAIGEALADELTPPFVLFGHSLGAVLAAELAAWLQRRARPGPLLLVVSARTGTGISPPDAVEYDDEAMVRWILELGGTAPGLLDAPGMRALVLSMMRHDLRMLRDYAPSFTTLDAPVLALGGIDDPDVTADDLERWRERTTGGYRLRQFPGGHFYLYARARAVAAELARAITAAPRPG